MPKTTYVTVKQAAERLGMSTADARNLTESGELPYVSRRMIDVKDVHAYVARLATADLP
jgi:excisionase family DNA binding protein